ncbi:MAG TPA: D-alanine--D-alanine ligase family protein [Anaerolineae bacterium]|mgnify:CR=1 FL=1|nr:D-alanine--D-alanine ligase family protein [Anaerolineae bacterium]HPL26993.1 D-alanine--D-alanine ligase family protein [Anaerolineae bacterium]
MGGEGHGKGKLRVAVVFGGRSGEHEVSLVSAASVMRALDKGRYEVYPVGITRGGRWLTAGDPMLTLQSGQGEAASLPAQAGTPAPPAQAGMPELPAQAGVPGPLAGRELVPGTREAGFPEVDVVFPVLHGTYGEDGTIQGLLEMADMAYVGAGVLGSALGMDKIAMKDVFVARGLPVVDYVALSAREWRADPARWAAAIEGRLGYPCFVKPANLGSSVGISKAHNREELVRGLDEAAVYDRRLVVEQGIDAREIEVSVLGNDEPEASLPGEVVPCNEFYDYAAKYLDGESQLLIPAPLSEEQTRAVRELAVRAFQALDCAGMARADFLLCRRTGRLYISELNTIPGFTSISMYPKLWEASGLPYPRLIDRLIELAIERHEERRRLRSEYPGARSG